MQSRNYMFEFINDYVKLYVQKPTQIIKKKKLQYPKLF